MKKEGTLKTRPTTSRRISLPTDMRVGSLWAVPWQYIWVWNHGSSSWKTEECMSLLTFSETLVTRSERWLRHRTDGCAAFIRWRRIQTSAYIAFHWASVRRNDKFSASLHRLLRVTRSGNRQVSYRSSLFPMHPFSRRTHGWHW